MNINWSDPKSKISDHFTVHEATWLPSWSIYHTPSEDEKTNILNTVSKMELIRAYVNAPINVHVWIRPSIVNNPNSSYNGQNYNEYVGGASNSAHITGLAVDFDVQGISCGDIKAKLLIKLQEFNIRCESDTTNWVHIDLYPANPNRYFKAK